MSSRPNSGSRTSTGHRRVESGAHHRHSSSSSGHNRSDSGQNLGSDQPSERRHGHHRSKSGVHASERDGYTESDLHNRVEFRSSQVVNVDQHPPYSRPTSLYPLKNSHDSGLVGPDALQPEREPIKFEINLVGAPPEVEQLVNNIKQVAEQFLYHWKTFPIILPSPVSQCDSFPTSQVSSDGSLGRSKNKYHLRDLFIAPSFDELDAVAVDAKGEPRKLSGKQLEYIRERGEFEVDSLNFPGQQHRWKLSQLLQKGTENSSNSLLNDLALALRFIFVTAKGRLFSQFFSVKEAAKALLAGLLRILDIFVGIPSLQAHNLDAKIREERSKYLVAELVCRVENEDALEMLCSYIKKQLRRAATEKFEVARECSQPPVSLPYRFLTPSGYELDLRLWDRTSMRKALPVLVAILERETRGWFLHFRERLIAELRAQKMPDEDIEREVNDAVMKEYLQRVYNSILSHPDINGLGEGIAQLLVQQAQSVVLMHKAVENVQHRLHKTQEEVKSRLRNIHPILSRIEPWLRAKLRNSEQRFSQENQWSAHEEALALCSSQRLHQTVYFLNRDLAFMKEVNMVLVFEELFVIVGLLQREPALLRELKKVKTPTRSFLWPTQIWLPTNWIVRRNFQGQSDVVPTVLSKHATSITTPRSDPSQPVFLVEKETVRTTTTRWPLWRIFNYFHRTWCWTWNAMFFFGIVIPWCSPLGLRALFLIEPFMPDLELSQVNGTLFPRKSSLTATLSSRLLSLWRHISKSRTHFETEPDTGFIGKGFTRHLNRIWNYFFKGLFGTIGLVFVFPLVCFLVINISVFIAFTAVIWMPLLTLVVQITNGIVYDLDSPEPQINRFSILFEALLWRLAVQGCIQPIAAIFIAVFVCPVIAVAILTVGIARYWFRLLWDASLFHLIIKKRGRIPACDSFAVKRIAGPGLAADYYFQISPEQALAAFEAKMEWDELAAYQTVVESTVVQPQKDFSHFIDACFGSFSAQLSKNGPYKNLEKEAQDLLSVLHEKLERRRRDLQTGLSVTVKSKIKLTTLELKIAIQQGAMMLEKFYPSRILPKLECTEDEFWDSRTLSTGDWAGLAALLYSELFSLDFLTPLDHTDTTFRLDAHPQADLTRYTEMVQCAQLGAGGPDLLGNVYTPRGNIQVHSPYLEVSAFNPRAKQSATGKKTEKNTESSPPYNSLKGIRSTLWMPWKRYYRPYLPDKLVIPLPVPHPAQIAVTIYNRDSDDPIILETEVCQSLLRCIEEHHASPDDSGIGRFRNGDDSCGTMSSSSGTLDSPPTRVDNSNPSDEGVYQWTLSNWGQRKRNNSGSVRVDLASPEDVTLDSDSTRVVFSAYGTTV
ncbi:hypothetical protein HUJ04_008066 [Dendroctonus ponderosae]|nr:hypothetical protein HUJ04_008066 [Dendroctonus ponderosae]KAH1016915.1 hypothetical protein HUJ04_008066 [Dendroctonus ponderosae]KAH1016916.1 hypothetical protein HUJ04_008066 [Dendroctonus ponderosae]KAH1026326.1 hypothetical protein HUJ05_010864 [Dendroctonus ponderosae]KAH1026327.1 hypothetical protein HUJ05_010864 [Dendroctonus ponderosae]